MVDPSRYQLASHKLTFVLAAFVCTVSAISFAALPRGTHLAKLALQAGIIVAAIYAFRRSQASFVRFPRVARVGFFTLLLGWAVVWLTITSAYRHQEGDRTLCGGYPHIFVCDSNASSPTDSWGQIDGVDILERTQSGPFWANVRFYSILLAPPYLLIVFLLPRDNAGPATESPGVRLSSPER